MSMFLFRLSQTCSLTQSDIMGTISKKSKLRSQKYAVYSYIWLIVNVSQAFKIEKTNQKKTKSHNT